MAKHPRSTLKGEMCLGLPFSFLLTLKVLDFLYLNKCSELTARLEILICSWLVLLTWACSATGGQWQCEAAQLVVSQKQRERMCSSMASHTHPQWPVFHQPCILSLPQRATGWRSSLRSPLWHSPEAEPPKPCRQPDHDYLEKAPVCFPREQLAHEGNQALRIRLITLQAAEASRALSLHAYVPCAQIERQTN